MIGKKKKKKKKKKKMTTDMLDKHDLDNYESEFKELALAELTDDVTVDIDLMKDRSDRMAEIEEQVGIHTIEVWVSDVTEQARKHGYASGRPFED